MRNIFLVLLFFSVLMLGGCATQKFVETNLYFGLSKDNGTLISDSAWNVFAENNIAETFDRGFTILTSEGKWLDNKSGKVYTEPSRVVISVNKMNHQLSQRIDSLRSTYKKIFQQQSVLRTDKKVTVNF
jgi:uncharacterized protein DUF3574